jgi:hypothetical protein
MATDWTAVATAAVGILAVSATGYAAVRTIKSNEKIISKYQLANMMSTALGHFTGKSQNRGVGIAALRIIKISSAELAEKGTLTKEEEEQYRASIRALLYGQLLYLYIYGQNRDEAHEAANMLDMSEWLFSDYIVGLKDEQKVNLSKAMERYLAYTKDKAAEIVIADLRQRILDWLLRGTVTLRCPSCILLQVISPTRRGGGGYGEMLPGL